MEALQQVQQGATPLQVMPHAMPYCVDTFGGWRRATVWELSCARMVVQRAKAAVGEDAWAGMSIEEKNRAISDMSRPAERPVGNSVGNGVESWQRP